MLKIIVIFIFILILIYIPVIEKFQVIETSDPFLKFDKTPFMELGPVSIENSPINIGRVGHSNQLSNKTNYFNTNILNIIVQDFIHKLNKTSQSWKLVDMEIKNAFLKKIISEDEANYIIELYITNELMILHLSIDVIFNTNTLKTDIQHIFIYQKKADNKNAYDPFFKNYFKINNILSLLNPFKSSEYRIIPEAKSLKKQETRNIKPFCLNHPNINNKQECESQNFIWDKPVINDNECLYYQSNKHYPNKRGGNKGGFCEFPSGIVSQGFRFFSANPLHKPFCYNCKSKPDGGIDQCCEDQLNTKKYPELNGIPDYKFSGDKLERSFYKQLFLSKKLNYF